MEKQIEIRRAEEKDIKKVMDLLSQVLEIHAKIRPDVFVSGTTKYTMQNCYRCLRMSKIRYMQQWMKKIKWQDMHFAN